MLSDMPAPGDGPGWYPDPKGQWQDRYFDGEKWTNQVRRPAKPTPTQPPGFLDRVREAPTWLKVAAPVLLVVVVVGAIGGDPESGNDNDASPTATTKESEPTAEQRREAARQQEQAKPRRIREVVGDEFGDQLEEISITKQIGGGYFVLVTYNEDENTTSDITRFTIEEEMKDAYEALFTTPGLDVNSAGINARIQLIDRFGKTSYGLGWDTRMKKSVAKHVNWNEKDVLDFEQLWTTVLQHPDLQ